MPRRSMERCRSIKPFDRTISRPFDALIKRGADVKAATRYGVTPMGTRGHERQRGRSCAGCSTPAPTRTPPRPGGETALMTAARTGSVDAVTLLARARRQRQRAETATASQTALMWAVTENHSGHRQAARRARRGRQGADQRCHAERRVRAGARRRRRRGTASSGSARCRRPTAA